MKYDNRPDWTKMDGPALTAAYNEMIVDALATGQSQATYRTIKNFSHGLESARTRCDKLWTTVSELIADHKSGAEAAPADALESIAEASAPNESRPSEGPTKESKVPKTKAKTKAKKANGAKKNGAKHGSKTEIIANLLKRQTGCTNADILKATGWPAVSVPAMAKAAGLKLKKEKVKGEVTRYYGS